MVAHISIKHIKNVFKLKTKFYTFFINKVLFAILKFKISGGYYTWRIRPGFRIIVLNTNFCARLNFWLLYNPIDPANHLKWLAAELLKAEQAGDKVHLLGHIAPDRRECTQAWVYNFINIVERFKDTIVGQFYGHSHADEFRVIYSNSNFSRPVGYQFVAPSVTTYTLYNSAYRTYDTDTNGMNNQIVENFYSVIQNTVIL
jgi:sphingomyelin phosphodiesterase